MRPVPIAAARVLPLRAAILRAGRDPAEAIFAGDEEPGALHLAILRDGEPVSVGSVIRERDERLSQPGQWRVRGMATAPELRGRGMGTVLLGALEQHVRAEGGRLLWCLARPAACSLYERGGLRAQGEPFEIAPIGPHLLMVKELGRP